MLQFPIIFVFLDIALDDSSSKTLQESLNKFKFAKDPSVYQLLLSMCSKPMQNARYLCSGWYENEDEYHHYALSVPFYTHFTSPIRRYPDVLVHRLLYAAIQDQSLDHWEKSELQKAANHCNVKKLAAKKASTESDELFFASFVRECGPYEVEGVVLKVLDRSFDCMLLNLSMVKRVYFDKQETTGEILKVSQFKTKRRTPALDIRWRSQPGENGSGKQVIDVFTKVSLNLVSNPNKPLEFQAVLNRPKF